MTDEAGTDRVGYYAAWTALEPDAAPYGENVSRALAAEAFADARAARAAGEAAGALEDRAERLELLGRSTTVTAVLSRAVRDAGREDHRDARERLRREDDLRADDFPLPDRMSDRADLDQRRADVSRSARRAARIEEETVAAAVAERTEKWANRGAVGAARGYAATPAGRWLAGWTRSA